MQRFVRAHFNLHHVFSSANITPPLCSLQVQKRAMGASQSFAESLIDQDDYAAMNLASASVCILCFLIIICLARRIFLPAGRTVELSPTLSEEQAVAIYRKKVSFMQSIGEQSRSTRARLIKQEVAAISSQYRVSPKAVLDVWNRKTWVSATSRLWQAEQT
jgi:hypothetical protein